MNKSLVKKVAYYGVFAALAVIIAYIERLIPIPIPVPGIKLGLANVVIVIILYAFNPRWAISISVLRVVLVSLLFSGVSGAMFALSGAILSFVVMHIVKRAKLFGVVGVSVTGGVTHGIAQIGVAAIIVQTPGLMFYTPVLIIAGVLTGVLIGYTAGFALKSLKLVQKFGA